MLPSAPYPSVCLHMHTQLRDAEATLKGSFHHDALRSRRIAPMMRHRTSVRNALPVCWSIRKAFICHPCPSNAGRLCLISHGRGGIPSHPSLMQRGNACKTSWVQVTDPTSAIALGPCCYCKASLRAMFSLRVIIALWTMGGRAGGRHLGTHRMLLHHWL